MKDNSSVDANPDDFADDVLATILQEATQPSFLPGHFSQLSVGDAQSSSGLSPSLTVHGNAQIFGTLTADRILQLSDERAKTGITLADHDALSIVKQLKIYHYNLMHSASGRRHIGMLAQQVRSVYPDAVETDSDTGLERVDVTSLAYLTIQALQQLSSQHQAFKDETNGRLGWVLLLTASWIQSAKSATQALISSQCDPTDTTQSPEVALPIEQDRHANADADASVPADARSQSEDVRHASSCHDESKAPEAIDHHHHTDQLNHASHACTSSSAEVSGSPPNFESDEEMIDYMLAALQSNDPTGTVFELCRCRIMQFGRQAVWQCYQQAEEEACAGSVSARSTFFKLLKQRKHEGKMRSVHWTED